MARRQNNKWVKLGNYPCPKPAGKGLIRFRLERVGEQVRLFVEEKAIGAFKLPGTTLGLALQGSTVRYRNVTWE